MQIWKSCQEATFSMKTINVWFVFALDSVTMDRIWLIILFLNRSVYHGNCKCETWNGWNWKSLMANNHMQS
jgi:hypothetical protein